MTETDVASLVGDLNRAEAERARQRGTENLEVWSLYELGLQRGIGVSRPEIDARRNAALRQAGLE